MKIGSGCRVTLCEDDLPAGRLIVRVSHLTAVSDRVVMDTHDPQRAGLTTVDGVTRITRRCVYGYWHRQENM
jgi:hypothetical protein